MNSPRSRARVVCGGTSIAVVDVGVVAHALDQAARLHLVEEAALAVDVVVLQVEQRDPRVAQRQVVRSR